MAILNFPHVGLTIGQKYPASPVVGVPTYTYDGEKWTTAADAIAGDVYVKKTGDSMSGPLTLSSDPVANLHSAPKQYVDSALRVYAAPYDAMAYNGLQVNGGFDVNQEKLGALTVGGGDISDVWRLHSTASTLGMAKVSASNLAGYTSYCEVVANTPTPTLAAADYCFIRHPIEGNRVIALSWGTANARPITLAFWTAHNKTGLYSGTVVNKDYNRCYAFIYTQTTADVWQYNVITIPGDTIGDWHKGSQVGMGLHFVQGMGSSYTAPTPNTWLTGDYYAAPGQVNCVATGTDTFRMTGLTVMPGTEAPSASRSFYIQRTWEREIEICRRYWQKSYRIEYVPGSIDADGAAFLYCTVGSSGNMGERIYFGNLMRVAPSITAYHPYTGTPGQAADESVASGATGPIIERMSQGGFRWYANSVGGHVNLTMHWTADARM